MLAVTVLTFVALGLCARAQPQFIDHGVGCPLAERRGVVTTTGADGHALAIALSTDLCPRRWLLVTDLDTGESRQVWYPEGVPNGPAYGSLLCSRGLLYTDANGVLLCFSPQRSEFTLRTRPAPGASAYLRIIEGPDGRIWAGAYGGAHLVSLDPETGETRDWGLMDPVEKYLSHLAYDDRGWIYCGIGTARYNIVGCNSATGEVRQLIEEDGRGVGTAVVHITPDGRAAGRAGEQWYDLYDGEATPLEARPEGCSVPPGSIYWGDVAGVLPDGRRLTAYDMEGKQLTLLQANGRTSRQIPIDYESEGSVIRVIAGPGPDGRVYAASAHPSRAVIYDPVADELSYMPGAQAWKSIAFQDRYVMGNVYGGGELHLYDTTLPWDLSSDPEQRNPRLVARYAPDINVPWGALAHPDGRHLLMSGQPGYGHRGGGIGIYNRETAQSALIPHADLVPEHSTMAMQALPNGDILGATTVSGGHGAEAAATEAVLYILDWESKRVAFQTVPVPGAREIRLLKLGPDDLAYGLSSDSQLFTFDPTTREVTHRADLSAHGGTVVNGLDVGPDGNLYAVLSKALLRIEPGSLEVRKLADTPGPASAGIAVTGGRLYFGIGSHLWSYGLSG